MYDLRIMLCGLCFMVYGLWKGLGCRVQSIGFMVHDLYLGFRFKGLELSVWGLGLRV